MTTEYRNYTFYYIYATSLLLLLLLISLGCRYNNDSVNKVGMEHQKKQGLAN